MSIRLIIILFSFFVLGKIYSKFKKQELSKVEASLWFVLWLGVLFATLLPHATDILALYLGIGRGADLLVYLSIVVIFYVIFAIYIKTRKIENNITKLVREIAIKEKKD